MMKDKSSMSGFGSPYLKKEGEAVHPDYIEADLSDEAYLKQLRAYVKWAGETYCARPNLMERLKKEE